MTPERWQQIDRIYHAALERAASDRGAFLDQACERDEPLRGEVEKLIAGHEQAGSFLASPAFEAAARALAVEQNFQRGSLLDQTLGHYHIVGILGEGGMGVVYRAEDSRLGRAVALKVLAPHQVADPQRLARFLQEARLASSLNHPNIATILDVGEADGHHYIVMELVEGESLARRLGQKPMKLALLIDLATQIAEALAEAHARRIVHRDIKSDNILVTPAGRAKVLDFGLSKRLPQAGEEIPSAVGARTETGLVIGTVSYMSPEQALGQAVDERSDLFSFGVVLYEMTTGRRPFAGTSTTSTIDKIIHEPPLPPAHLNHEVPPALEQVVLKLLEKNIEDRYQSARELVVDLRRLKRAADAGSLATTRPRPSTIRRLSWKQRLALAAVLAFVATGMFFLGRRESTLPPQSAMRFSEITNFSGVEAQPALSRDGRSVAFVSNRGGQFDIWVGLVTGGSLVRVTSDPNLEARPQWSPDGSRIAYARLNDLGLWDIWVVQALGGTPRRILSNAGDPSWSPDGSLLAYANHATSGIWICDPSGANPREQTRAETRIFHRQPAFSRDGRRLAFVSRAYGPYGELVVTDLATRQVRQVTHDGAMVQSPVWSMEDRSIYFSSSRGGTMNIWKIAAEGGDPEQITVGLGDDVDLDLSADGKRLVFSTYRMNINLVEADLDAAAGQVSRKWLTTDSARGELAPAYSPDGRRIVYFSNKKGVEREGIWVMEADGTNSIPLVEDGRENIFPRWTRDGQAVVYVVVGPPNEVWRVGLSGTPPERIAEGVIADFVDVNREGRVMFYGPGYRIQILDPTTKQVQTLEEARGISPWGPEGVSRWRPDGNGFAYQAVSDNPLPSAQDLWIVDAGGTKRRVFSGWVAWYEWAGPDELIVLEGKPDLNGVLWRVRPDGQRVRTPVSVPLINTYEELEITARFDIHPDRRRIVVSVPEFHEADIGMIENIR